MFHFLWVERKDQTGIKHDSATYFNIFFVNDTVIDRIIIALVFDDTPFKNNLS